MVSALIFLLVLPSALRLMITLINLVVPSIFWPPLAGCFFLFSIVMTVVVMAVVKCNNRICGKLRSTIGRSSYFAKNGKKNVNTNHSHTIRYLCTLYTHRRCLWYLCVALRSMLLTSLDFFSNLPITKTVLSNRSYFRCREGCFDHYCSSNNNEDNARLG